MVTVPDDIGALLRAEMERLCPEPTPEQLTAKLARIQELHDVRVRRVMQMGSHPPMRPAWGGDA